MLGMAIILGLSAVIIAGLLPFWNDIVNWLRKAANKIKEVLGVTVEGTRTFIVKTKEGFKNKSKYYNKNKLTNEWEETTYTKQVSESEIPPEILAKVRTQEIGIDVSTTEELRLALDNAG
jgi:hypothetical protein